MGKIRYNEFGYIDFSNMVYQKNQISWRESVGCKVDFLYKDVYGTLIIDDYQITSDDNHMKIQVLYNGKSYMISRESLHNNRLNNIVNDRCIDYVYNINDIIEDSKRKLKILDRYKKGQRRYYFVECLNCGYKFEITEQALWYYKTGCAVCSKSKVIKGFNDFNTLYPDLAKYIVNENDKYLGISSTKNIEWVCPHCGHIVKDKIRNVVQRGIRCEFCDFRYSFGEICMANLLDELKVDYTHDKSLEWSDNKRYDFYIPKNNVIIEINGLQHYEDRSMDSPFIRSLKEEQENDKYKMELALNNGINYYIVIDCRKSNIEWFKNNVLSNKDFINLFDCSNIKWESLYNYSKFNIYNDICNLWNNGYTVKQISIKFKKDRHFIADILNYANDKSMVNFSDEEKDRRIHTARSTPIKCVETKQCFSTIRLCCKLSEELFGCTLKNNAFAKYIRNKQKYKGYTFEYITREEFNQIKKDSPDLAFGESFVHFE